MAIPSEDQYYIKEVKVFITREGNGVVDRRHLKTPEDYAYYKVVGEETRYVICGAYGIHGSPARIYEGGLENECYFASGICSKTRRYVRKLDHTYFVFYDDAEEVLNNIIVYIKWLKKVHLLNLKKAQIKKILNENNHFMQDVPDFQERITLKAGSNVKMRSGLSKLERFLQDEKDLIEASL